MKLWQAGRRWLRRIYGMPGVQVPVLAMRNYILHQSANQAGSVAFSFLIAMFPLLLFLSAAAGYVGRPGDAAAFAERVLTYAPPVVWDTLRPVIDQVIGQRHRALLAVGLLVTIWTASSGMQSIRTALNLAYGVERGLSFWRARIKVILFTLIVGAGTLAAFSSIIVLPYVWQLLERNVGVDSDVPWLRNSVRYGSAYVVLVILYALMYGWLPDIRQRLRTVLPGAVLGALMWVGAAATLSYTLRSAGKLVLVYGSFAGLVATLVFLYLSAVTLILGAEINGVLRSRMQEAGG